MKKIGIIGCGAIGGEIAKAIDKGLVDAHLETVYDVMVEKCIDLAVKLKNFKPIVCTDFKCVLDQKLDLVVEAASQDAVKRYVLELIQKGVDVVVLSVGALLDDDLRTRISEASKSSGAKVYIPSGAVCGVDALNALSVIGVDEVKLTTRKNPRSVDRKSLINLGYRPDEIFEATSVFKGPAEEAVKKLPFNINVAATLKLASRSNVHVEFVVDPNVDANIHEIEISSKASKVKVTVTNYPHPDNPKTSYLAALSAIALLKRILEEGIIVGT